MRTFGHHPMNKFVFIFTAQLACAVEPQEDSGVYGDSEAAFIDEVAPKASGVSGYPQGMVCGMSYTSNYASPTTVVKGTCEGKSTLSSSAATNFTVTLNDGDYGLSAGYGFAHQYRTYSSSGVNGTTSNQLLLPKGTACGFKHSKNTSTLSCLGYDPGVKCPSGWTAKSAQDSSSSYSFQWCEYQDPYSYCTTSSCMSGVPSGTVCGITHNNYSSGTGYCNGIATTSGCPTGWTRYGYYDRGMPATKGIAWCMKN